MRTNERHKISCQVLYSSHQHKSSTESWRKRSKTKGIKKSLYFVSFHWKKYCTLKRVRGNKFCSDLTLLPISSTLLCMMRIWRVLIAWVDEISCCYMLAIDALQQQWKKLFASSFLHFQVVVCVKYTGNRNCWQFSAIASTVVKHFR